jgi:hypothetical protein
MSNTLKNAPISSLDEPLAFFFCVQVDVLSWISAVPQFLAYRPIEHTAQQLDHAIGNSRTIFLSDSRV